MLIRRPVVVASFVAALSPVALSSLAGPELVSYPKDKGILYGTIDRVDNKQVREVYAPKTAIDAAKAGTPNEKADLKPCFGRHKPKADQDCVFTLPRMKEAK